jgi:hypothetical protein
MEVSTNFIGLERRITKNLRHPPIINPYRSAAILVNKLDAGGSFLALRLLA